MTRAPRPRATPRLPDRRAPPAGVVEVARRTAGGCAVVLSWIDPTSERREPGGVAYGSGYSLLYGATRGWDAGRTWFSFYDDSFVRHRSHGRWRAWRAAWRHGVLATGRVDPATGAVEIDGGAAALRTLGLAGYARLAAMLARLGALPEPGAPRPNPAPTIAAPDGAVAPRHDLRRAARRNPGGAPDRADVGFVGSDGVPRTLRADRIPYPRPTGHLAWQVDRWEVDGGVGSWRLEWTGSADVVPGEAPRVAIERPRWLAARVPREQATPHLARALGIGFFVALDAAAVALGMLPPGAAPGSPP